MGSLTISFTEPCDEGASERDATVAGDGKISETLPFASTPFNGVPGTKAVEQSARLWKGEGREPISTPGVPDIELVPAFGVEITGAPAFLIDRGRDNVFRALTEVVRDIPGGTYVNLVIVNVPGVH